MKQVRSYENTFLIYFQWWHIRTYILAAKKVNPQSRKTIPAKTRNVVKKVIVEATFEVSDDVIDQILAKKKRSLEETIILGKFLVNSGKNRKFVSDLRNRKVEWVVQKKPKRTNKDEPAGNVNETQIVSAH